MVGDIKRGEFDVVVCEAVDCLGCRLADTSDFLDRLNFQSIKLHTVGLGEITPMHVAVMGMMAQMALKDLGDNTKRGQLGRVLKGKIAGGLGYGYCAVLGNGKRTIIEHKATTVIPIFKGYADGKSPESIARDLNREHIPCPRGRPWSNTTLKGQAARGTGLLNNEMYRGMSVWNRCSYIKDSHRGKKVVRPNRSTKYEVIAVAHLRIAKEDLWLRVKARQNVIRQSQSLDHAGQKSSKTSFKHLNASHRPGFLLSGLLKRGCCNGGYTVVGKDRYGCATGGKKAHVKTAVRLGGSSSRLELIPAA